MSDSSFSQALYRDQSQTPAVEPSLLSPRESESESESAAAPSFAASLYDDFEDGGSGGVLTSKFGSSDLLAEELLDRAASPALPDVAPFEPSAAAVSSAADDGVDDADSRRDELRQLLVEEQEKQEQLQRQPAMEDEDEGEGNESDAGKRPMRPDDRPAGGAVPEPETAAETSPPQAAAAEASSLLAQREAEDLLPSLPVLPRLPSASSLQSAGSLSASSPGLLISRQASVTMPLTAAAGPPAADGSIAIADLRPGHTGVHLNGQVIIIINK